jgi:hypothetical protein
VTDLEWLAALCAVVYLTDCGAWLSGDEWTFVGTRQGAFSPRRGPAIALARGGVSFGGVLPPLATLVRCREQRGLSLDERAVTLRLDAYLRAVRPLRLACNLLFVALAALLGSIVWSGALPASRWPLAGVVVALWAGSVWLYARAHAQLHGGTAEPRWSPAIGLLTSPLGALRACDVVARPLCSGYHPLAVAAVLCDREAFVRLARAVRYDAGRRGPDGQDERSDEAAAIDAMLRRLKLLDAVEAPPAREHEIRTHYCPRCGVQYRAGIDRCADCVDVPLRAVG